MWEFGSGKGVAVELPTEEEEEEGEGEEVVKVLVTCETIRFEIVGTVVLAVGIVIRELRFPVAVSLVDVVDDSVELAIVTSATAGNEESIVERVVCGLKLLELPSVVIDTNNLAEMEAVPEIVTEAIDPIVGTVLEVVNKAMESIESAVPDVARLNVTELVGKETDMTLDPDVGEPVGEEPGTAFDTVGSTVSKGLCSPPSAHQSTILSPPSSPPFPKENRTFPGIRNSHKPPPPTPPPPQTPPSSPASRSHRISSGLPHPSLHAPHPHCPPACCRNIP